MCSSDLSTCEFVHDKFCSDVYFGSTIGQNGIDIENILPPIKSLQPCDLILKSTVLQLISYKFVLQTNLKLNLNVTNIKVGPDKIKFVTYTVTCTIFRFFNSSWKNQFHSGLKNGKEIRVH